MHSTQRIEKSPAFLVGALYGKLGLADARESRDQVVEAITDLPENRIAQKGRADVEVSIRQLDVDIQELARAVFQLLLALSIAPLQLGHLFGAIGTLNGLHGATYP